MGSSPTPGTLANVPLLLQYPLHVFGGLEHIFDGQFGSIRNRFHVCDLLARIVCIFSLVDTGRDWDRIISLSHLHRSGVCRA